MAVLMRPIRRARHSSSSTVNEDCVKSILVWFVIANERFKAEICSSISKAAPDFCTVYVVSKGGKVTSVRQAVRQAPAVSPLRTMIQGPKPEPVHAQKWTPPAPAPAPASSGAPMFQENHIM